MNAIEVAARVFDTDGKPAANLALRIEAFVLDGNGWTPLQEVRTNGNGAITARIATTGTGHVYAPSVRLVEAGEPAPRVLAEGGMITITSNQRARIVRIDFGEIEQLEETAHTRLGAQGQPATGQHVVAGQPRRGQISAAVMVRAMAASNSAALGAVAQPQLVMARTSEAQRILGADFARPGATAQPDATRPATATLSPEFEVQLRSLRADLSAKDIEIDTTRRRVSGLESSLSEAAAKLAAAEAERARLASETSRFREQIEKQAPINTLARSIASEADTANKSMADEGAAFRIANLSVTLRGAIANDGKNITLANLADLPKGAAAAALQDISFSLIPNRIQPSIPEGSVKTPNILGLTESAARRVLAEAGLRMESAQRPKGAGAGFTVGQAIQQSPAAGGAAVAGSTVIVVFAAP